ncbi:hypothetical protein X975_09947, partial [Stegodyphus mimosarum]
MGICVCKEAQSESDEETITPPLPRMSVNSVSGTTDSVASHVQNHPAQQSWDLLGTKLSSVVDKLVLET